MAGPGLTPLLEGNPAVEVFFDTATLDPSAATLQISRLAEDREWKVRGGWNVATGGPSIDWEVPFGTRAVYRAEQFDVGGGSLGYTDTTEIVLDVEGTWVHNPLQPAAGVRVELDDESARELLRPTPGKLVYPEGAAVPRRIGSRRRALEGVRLVLNVDGDAIDGLEAALGGYEDRQNAVLCVRTSEPVMWPRTFFCASEALRKVDRTVRMGGEWVQFVGDVDEVEPPAPGVVAPFLRYADLDAAYPTYAERDAHYGTYAAQDRDYSLVGFAG